MEKAKRVLIVEDTSSMRGVIKATIASMGTFTIVEAVDGQQALKSIESSHFDLVICDWDMPKMTGLELLQAIRAQDRFKILPFVMLTANSQLEKIKQAISLGVTDYVAKPFQPATLINKVSAYLIEQ